jgi:hypothetical protein
MSVDSPYDQAERYLAYGTGIYVMIIVWIIYLQLYWPSSGSSNSSSSSSPANNSTTSQVIGRFLPTDYLSFGSLTSIGFAVGYFFKYLGIHDLFDRLAFKFNREVRRDICERLRSYFYNKFPEHASCRTPTNHELIKIFYEFIDKQQDSWIIYRALSFSFWLKYRLSMNLIVFSIIGVLSKLYLDRSNFRHDLGNWIYYPYAFFIVIAVVSFIISQFKVRADIKRTITEAQLDKIIYESSEELNKLLKGRFDI